MIAPTPAEIDPQGLETEAWRAKKTRELIQQGNADRFAAMCPKTLRPESTDWAHTGLAASLSQINQVREWTSTSFGGRGILAHGPTYRGKSRAMWALIHRLQVVEGRRVSFFTAADFFARLGEQVHFGRDDARSWVDSIARLPLLFLDDLGQEALAESRKEVGRQWLFALLDIRRGEGLPLFVTTNLSGEEIATPPGRHRRADAGEIKADPFVSRLLDLCQPVKF